MEFESVREVWRELMPDFYGICQGLRRELEGWEVRVLAGRPGGTATPNPWHVSGVACRLRDGSGQIAEVALQVDLLRLTSAPLIDAYVAWDLATVVELDEEFVLVEERLFARPLPLTDEAVQLIKVSLPLLVAPLKAAVRRGFPREKRSAGGRGQTVKADGYE